MRKLLAALIIFSSLTVVSTYAAGDPFAKPPAKIMLNCDAEHRLKCGVKIKNIKELIAFLKSRQSKEASFDNPSKEAFIPESMTIRDYTFKIDLDQLKKKVIVSDVTGILSSNKKIYSLGLGIADYPETRWPWGVTILVSDNGDVSIRHCAGK